MRPFTIEEYIKHPDWKIQTRKGKPVRILCHDRKDDNYGFSVIALVGDDKYEAVVQYKSDGKVSNNNLSSPYDLFFVSRKLTKTNGMLKS